MTTRSNCGTGASDALRVLMQPVEFACELIDWQRRHGRHDLPWQQQINAYRVWVSEIMLQQTQVSTVIDYFNRFMKRFPTLDSLANADIDEVTALWTGLGYYARARNLHKAARICQQEHAGRLPASVDELIALPGIGRSTAGAIASIVHDLPAPILDGNVRRVLCRLAGVTVWAGDSKTTRQLWQLAEHLTPEADNARYTQAIMDLGATICTPRQPDCNNCPFSQQCQACLNQLTDSIPASKPRRPLPERQIAIKLIRADDQRIWLEKRPPSGIWGGLYSLPEIELDHPDALTAEATAPLIRHQFSHYRLWMQPLLFSGPGQRIAESDSGIWCHADQLESLGLPRPIKTFLNNHFTEQVAWQDSLIV